MPDNAFIDSNVCLYIHDKQNPKFFKAKTLLENRPTISTQVLLENINVCLKKLRQTKEFALAHAKNLQNACKVFPITNQTMTKSFFIFEKYGYSIFDSLIIAASLEADCTILYSEDMHDSQIIEGKIKIINPFK
jgi:predicted nucleic acid-binding protein